jgi:hypothetical protein
MGDEIKILNFEKLTKDYILNELLINNLDKKDVDQYLDLISYINEGYHIYNVETNKGSYFLHIKSDD